ncbi:MAG TPA: hypothetical protein P5125_02305 [Kiritimatiellia bacterium]|nr:hypothetical protein [Kiritimatiellia bacterium]HOR96813.1 hypothetical protein [Kiritimatiellia bacterium]HPK36984.1 hypothetical protein [Kiritimatiellia bacterium]HPW74462.1 hypothetical protein [Kiritimatiellia bacterium]HRU19166.1 hypothetical protein [Kiritimatiellia bacterium]
MLRQNKRPCPETRFARGVRALRKLTPGLTDRERAALWLVLALFVLGALVRWLRMQDG